MAAVYLPAERLGFVWDDHLQIVANRALQDPVSWSDLAFKAVWDPVPGKGPSGLYRPLAGLLWGVERTLFGATPGHYHVVSIVLHLWTAGVVALLARALGATATAASVAALVFGLLPLNSEVVLWIGCRHDGLATPLALTALLAQATWRGRATQPYLIGLCTFAACASKESAVVLPALLVLVDVVVLRAAQAPLTAALRPASYAASTLGVLAYLALRAGLAIDTNGAIPGAEPLAFVRAVATAGVALASKAVWPSALSVLAAYHPLAPATVAATLVVQLALVVGLLAYRTTRPAAFGLIAAWMALLTTGIAVPLRDTVSERYGYWSAALLIAGCAPLATAVVGPATEPRRLVRVALGAFAAVWVLQSAVVIHSRIEAFTSDRALFEAALAAEPGNYMALHQVATVEEREGNEDAALALYLQSAAAYPTGSAALVRAGSILLQRGELDRAYALATEAEAHAPDRPDPRVLEAEIDLARGAPALAAESASRASTSSPWHPVAALLAGLAYEQLGDSTKAAPFFERACMLDPTLSDACDAAHRTRASLASPGAPP